MSDPIVDPSDLSVYLNDPDIDTVRAEFFIGQAQMLCEAVLSPLPVEAAAVVTRVAGRGYTSVTSPRQQQLAAAGSPYAGAGGTGGGIYLERGDRADLRRLSGGGGAFTIDMLPADYAATLPPWDVA